MRRGVLVTELFFMVFGLNGIGSPRFLQSLFFYTVFLHRNCQVISSNNQTRPFFFVPLLQCPAIINRLVDFRSEMHEGKTLCMRLPGDMDRVLRIEVWPVRALYSGFEPAFGDEEIGIPPECNRIVADAGIGAVRDHLSVNLQPVPETWSRVNERAALHSKR